MSKTLLAYLNSHLALTFIVIASVLLPAGIVKAQENDLILFDIPPQAVGSALDLYSQQAQLQFIYQTDVVEGRMTEGVRGWHTPTSALTKLLKQTALIFEFTEQDTIIVRALTPEETQRNQSQLAMDLRKKEKHLAKKKQEPDNRALAKEDSVTAGVSARPRLDGLGVEEIVVSARRRTERLQDYAGSASVFGGQFLIDTRVDGMEDIVRRISNASFEERSGGSMNISIRGSGTSTFGSATNTDTGVGLYYDEIYSYVQGSRIPLVFYDMDRIEVFKGPQGSLYGRNAVGGALVAHTARPHHEYEASVRIDLGEFDTRTAEAKLNIPVNEHIAIRFSGYYDDRDSYFSNVNKQKERGDEVAAGRARFRYSADDELEILLGYERIEEDKGPQVLVPNRFGKDFISVSDTDGKVRRNTDRWLSHINWHPNDRVEFRSITGYTEIDSFNASDLNNLATDPDTGNSFIGIQSSLMEAYQLTQEFLALSTGESSLEWLLGFSFFADHRETAVSVTSGFATTELETSDTSTERDTSMFAAFADVRYRIADNWVLGASLRYSDEERTAERSSFFVINSDTGLPFEQDEFDFEVDYSRLSPGANVSYFWTQDVMTYFKIATSYQSGGTNNRAASGASAVYGASTAISYEAGVKTTWFDNRLIANLILFRLEQEDYQLRIDNPPFNEFDNVGEARTDGIEIELVAELTDWMTTGLVWGYLDAAFKDATVTTFGNLNGKRLPGIPEHTLTLSADVHFPIAYNATFYLRADYAITEGGFLDFSESIALDDHAIFDIKAGIEFRDKYEIHFFAENLFNDVYVITKGLGLVANMPSPPRVIGVGASIQF